LLKGITFWTRPFPNDVSPIIVRSSIFASSAPVNISAAEAVPLFIKMAILKSLNFPGPLETKYLQS
jgi:hypothetical protein